MADTLTPYEAERRHKDSAEDRLTSRFFGHLNNMQTETQKQILSRLGLDFGDHVAIKSWQSFGTGGALEREVDAVLEYSDTLLIVEDKLNSDFTVEQLVEEYHAASGVMTNKTVSLLCISSHPSEPREIDKAEAQLGKPIIWISWLRCLSILREVVQGHMDPKTEQNIRDLIVYMESLGFDAGNGFLGMDDWTAFLRMLDASEKLLDEHVAGNAVRQGGFDWETPEPRYRLHSYLSEENSYWGRWFYKGDKEDFGYWIAVGLIEGVNQVECAAYHTSTRRRAQLPAEYLVSIVGDRDGWEREYVKYSRFLPVNGLRSRLLHEQLAEISDFIRICVSQTLHIFS